MGILFLLERYLFEEVIMTCSAISRGTGAQVQGQVLGGSYDLLLVCFDSWRDCQIRALPQYSGAYIATPRERISKQWRSGIDPLGVDPHYDSRKSLPEQCRCGGCREYENYSQGPLRSLIVCDTHYMSKFGKGLIEWLYSLLHSLSSLARI